VREAAISEAKSWHTGHPAELRVASTFASRTVESGARRRGVMALVAALRRQRPQPTRTEALSEPSLMTVALPPGPELAFGARGTLDPTVVIGETPDGVRRTAPISGGEFEGPKLRGQRWPAARPARGDGAARDRQTRRANGVLFPTDAALRRSGRLARVAKPLRLRRRRCPLRESRPLVVLSGDLNS
jgi:hypothetical protein